MNDSIKATLATYGYTGSINDAYYRYLLAESGLSTSGHWHVNDLEKATLAGFGYTGSLNDMWSAFLTTSGYTGSLDDKKQAFWSDGLGFTPIAIPLTHSLIPTRGSITPSFTRATTATVMGYGPTDNAVDGLKLLTVAANEARFVGARRISEGVWSNTFADGSLIPAATNTGYLAEGARTNLCLQSNAFTTTWTANGTPAATQNVIGPDGGTTGWTLTDNNAASIEGVGQTIALTAATYTYSVFFNKTTGAQSSYPVIATDNGVSRIAACTVDTTNGVATVWTAYTGLTVQTSSATCVSHNENYWRVSLTFLATAENWTHYLIVAATTNATQSTGSFDPTAQGSAVFYGAQVEPGSSASTYIATTTAAVTRAADVLTYPSAGNVGSAGTMYLEVYPAGTPATVRGLSLNDETAANFNEIYWTAGTNRLAHAVTTGSVAQANYFIESAGHSNGVQLKAAATYAASGFSGSVNGAAPLTSGAGTPPTVTVISVGHRQSASQSGSIYRNVRIWNRALSSSELQAITR